jgi:prepilin-type N-terminal cleavage/methylation domain-containing protein
MTRMTRRIRRSRPRRGFSLTEVLMAMTLLSVVLLSLAKMSFTLSQRSRWNDQRAKRNAVLMQEANKFGAMPYANLAGFSEADKSVTTGDFSYTRRLDIEPVGTTGYKIKIVVAPARDATQTDSVFVYRTKPAGSPLCVGC